MEGFLDVVQSAWGGPLVDADACGCLDHKLRHLTRALRSWRATNVGDISLQLAAARAVVYEFDTAQETRQLSAPERQLHRELKVKILGLASLERAMARQRARTRHLRDGDACTKYLHLQACHRRRKNYMFAVSHNGQTFTEEEAKAGLVYDYYNTLLGSPFIRQHRIDLEQLWLPRLDLSDQAIRFTPDEVARVVREKPSGPDGFGGAFYKAAWGPTSFASSLRSGSSTSEVSST